MALKPRPIQTCNDSVQFQIEIRKLAVRFESLFKFADILRSYFAEDVYEMCKRFMKTLVQPLLCPLNLFVWWCSLIDVACSSLLRPHYTEALFLRLGLGTRVIRHGNGAFRNRFQPEKFYNAPPPGGVLPCSI